jgi:predicted RNase H-like HicB family nuclease
MKKIKAIIEKAKDGGYGIYCPEVKGIVLYGYGLSEEEAKENLQENVEMILEHGIETDQAAPESLSGEIEFDYRYDFSGFFKAYPVFNVSELASMVGINPSLMRKYKNGIAFASEKQRTKINTGIHRLSQKLSTVQF